MRNRVLVYTEAVDVAAEGAVWYARTIAHGPFEALHVPTKGSDSGIHARWFDLTGGESKLDIRPAGSDATAAVLDTVDRLRSESDDTVVTVVLPEQFRKRSLLAAAHRAQFRLKLRLLAEPRTVVADVTAVTERLRPAGRDPGRLVVRVLAAGPDEPTLAAVEYARLLGVADLRAVHFGPLDWDASELPVPVDEEPLDGGLGNAVLAYVRRLTSDPATAINVVLPERGDPAYRQLRNRQAFSVKRCLLFEPHVILSSVPHQD